MRAKFNFSRSILPKLLLGVILLLAFSFFATMPASVQAQSAPTATPSPNPTIIALENQIATQQVQIEELQHLQKRKLEDLSFDVMNQLFEDKKQLYFVSALATFLGVLGSFFGIKTYNDINKKVQEKIKKSIDKEYKRQIEEADIELIPIRIQKSELLSDVVKRLKLYGLQNLSFFSFYSGQLTRGIVIVVINSEESEKEFQEFLKKYDEKLNPQQTAFILYANNYRVSAETIGMYPNLTMANMPATVGIAVFNIGKTLRNTAEINI